MLGGRTLTMANVKTWSQTPKTAVRELLSENCCQKIAVRVLRTGQRIAFEQSSRPQIALEAVPRFVISAEARRSQIIRFFSQQCRLLGIAMPFL